MRCVKISAFCVVLFSNVLREQAGHIPLLFPRRCSRRDVSCSPYIADEPRKGVGENYMPLSNRRSRVQRGSRSENRDGRESINKQFRIITQNDDFILT